MPRVLNYAEVLESLTQHGLECLYHNSGAFGFPEGMTTYSVGWLLQEDPTIRALARPMAKIVDPPVEKTLATMAGRMWAEHLGNQLAWVMPKSHWAYELDFGNYQWLPTVMSEAGLAAESLKGRNDGSAVEFDISEQPAFETFIERLLRHLVGSDFMVAFSGGGTICTVHSHKQLWWTTRDATIADALQKA